MAYKRDDQLSFQKKNKVQNLKKFRKKMGIVTLIFAKSVENHGTYSLFGGKVRYENSQNSDYYEGCL